MFWKGSQSRVVLALILWALSFNAFAISNIFDDVRGLFQNSQTAQDTCNAAYQYTCVAYINGTSTNSCGASASAWGWRTGYASEPDNNYHYHTFEYCGSACPSNSTADENGQCQCNNGATDHPNCLNVPPPPACPQGEQFHWQDTAVPDNMAFCHDGCEYILPPQTNNPDTSGGIINIGNGVYTGTASGTGVECDPAPTYSDPPPTNNQCVIDGAGNAICFDTSPNCSIYNGVQYCVPDIPDGGCVYNEKGFICAPGSTPPPNTEGVTPEKTGTIEGDKGTGSGVQQGDVYNQDTTNNTVYNSGGGGGSCGGTGQEPCKIDESGTPDPVPEDQFVSKLDGAWDTFKDSISTPENVGSGDGAWGDFDPFGWMASSSCQQLSFNFLGHLTTFPGADGCARFEHLKSLLGWALYILTGLSLFEIATRRPE